MAQDRTPSQSVSRRKLLKALAAGGGAVGTVQLLPRSWVKPLADTVVIPLHAQSSMGSVLFGSDNGGSLFTLNILTGAGTLVGTMAVSATEIEFDPTSGRAWAQQRNGTFTITEFSIATAASIGSPVDDGASFNGLEFVGATLYGTSITSGGSGSTLSTLDPGTGTSTPIGLTGLGPISGLAFDGSTMYGIEGGAISANLVTINLSTGAATIVGNTGITGAGSLQFGPDGNLYAGGDSDDGGNLYRVNPSTGSATLVGPTGFSNVTGLTLVSP